MAPQGSRCTSELAHHLSRGRKSARSRLKGFNKSSWHARTEMHQTKESGSVQSRARKGVCASAQRLGAPRGSRRARPPTPTPRAPRHAPGATAPPGSSPRSRWPRGRPGPPHQVRKLSLGASPGAGGRRRCVQPGPRGRARPRPALTCVRAPPGSQLSRRGRLRRREAAGDKPRGKRWSCSRSPTPWPGIRRPTSACAPAPRLSHEPRVGGAEPDPA